MSSMLRENYECECGLEIRRESFEAFTTEEMVLINGAHRIHHEERHIPKYDNWSMISQHTGHTMVYAWCQCTYDRLKVEGNLPEVVYDY